MPFLWRTGLFCFYSGGSVDILPLWWYFHVVWVLLGTFASSGGAQHSKKIAVGDIAYIEADRDNCILHMVDGVDHRLSCPMCDVLDRFDPRIYVRVHRSFVVNICMVSEICKTMVFMDNGMTIKVGDMYKDSILDKFPIIGIRKREK